MRSYEYHRLGMDDRAGWQAWEEFIHTAPGGTFYHSRAWLLGLAEGLGQAICVHAVLHNGAIQAGAVLRRGKRFGLVVGRKPWATAYNGPIWSRQCAPGTVAFLTRRLLRDYDSIRLVHSPGLVSPLDGADPGWQLSPAQTPTLSLCDLELLWQSFDRKARQRVRKAESLGVTIVEQHTAHDFHALYRHTYSNHRIPMSLSGEEIEAALSLARLSGNLRIVTAFTAAGEPAASVVVGRDARRAYFMLAGSHPVHRKTDAMSLLWWRLMQDCAKTVGELDLVGAGVASVDRFKSAFNPRMMPVVDATRLAMSLGGLALRGAAAARNLVRIRKRGPLFEVAPIGGAADRGPNEGDAPNRSEGE